MTAEMPLGKRQAFELLARNVVCTKDDENMEAFLLTYPHFKPQECDLFTIWVEQFEVACNSEKETKKYNADRMLEFMKLWWNTYPQDFSKTSINRILNALKKHKPIAVNTFKLQFLKAVQPSTASNASVGPTPNYGFIKSPFLPMLLGRRYSSDAREGGDAEEEERERMLGMPGDSATMVDLSKTKPKKTTMASQVASGTSSSSVIDITPAAATTAGPETSAMDFLDMSCIAVAREMTMLEFDLFSKIHIREFLNQTWQKRDKHLTAPNISAYITRFNEVSYWVVTEILMTSGVKEQMSVIKKFIQLAHRFLQLNNFNSLMQVLSALNNSSIQRLKAAWEILPEKEKTSFAEMEELMVNQQNFSAYYAEFKKRPFPKIPYFALFLRDCTFIMEGNKPYTKNGMINFEFMSMISDRLKIVTECQSRPFDLPRLKDVQNFLSNIQYIDDEDALYMLSLKAQPSMWVNNVVEEVIKEDEDSSDRSDSQQSSSSAVVGSGVDADDSATADELTSNDCYSEDEASSPDVNHSKRAASKNEGADLRKMVANKEKEKKEERSKNSKPQGKQTSKKKKKTAKRKKRTIDTSKLEATKLEVNSIIVPEHLVPFFHRAERIVDEYFSNCVRSTEKGTIVVKPTRFMDPHERLYGQERLILVRASSMAVDFFSSLRENFGFFGLKKKDLESNAQREQSEAVLVGFGFGSVDKSSSRTGGGKSSSSSDSATSAEEQEFELKKRNLSLFAELSEEITAKLLYDFGYVCGSSHCRAFAKHTGTDSVVDRWAMGPIYFVYSGGANPELSDKCKMSLKDFYAESCNDFSFEAHCWLTSGSAVPKLNPALLKYKQLEGADSCLSVCHYMCGFASGWTAAAFNVDMCAVEPQCRGRGDAVCTLILCRPDGVEKAIRSFCNAHNLPPGKFHQVIRYCNLEAKDALMRSDKLILSSVSSSSSPSPSGRHENKRSDSFIAGRSKGVPVNYPVFGKKHLPRQIESKLNNAAVISTATTDEIALQEDCKAAANKSYSALFTNFICDPSKGEVTLDGEERYLFLRAETLSTDFYPVIGHLLSQQSNAEEATTARKKVSDEFALSFATSFLYDLGRCFAISDQNFFRKSVRAASSTSKTAAYVSYTLSLSFVA
ncbi:hypothetical protein QOT17_002542 [Balamuthia mandrillaris]